MVTEIFSDLNSITPRKTKFARERLQQLLEKIADMRGVRTSSKEILVIAGKLGITQRLKA